jgi:hypothetical protein
MQGFVLKGLPFHQTLMRLLSAQAFVVEQQQRQRCDRDNWRKGMRFFKKSSWERSSDCENKTENQY